MVRCQKTNCANFDSDDLPHSFLSWEKLGHTGSRPCPHICCGSNIWLLGGSSIWRTTQEMEPAWAQVSLVHIWSTWLGFTGLVFRIFFHQAAVGGGSRLHGPGAHLHAVRLGLGPPRLRRHSYWSGERILAKLPLLDFWWGMGVYFILACDCFVDIGLIEILRDIYNHMISIYWNWNHRRIVFPSISTNQPGQRSLCLSLFG